VGEAGSHDGEAGSHDLAPMMRLRKTVVALFPQETAAVDFCV
jgi:hypothetical protein